MAKCIRDSTFVQCDTRVGNSTLLEKDPTLGLNVPRVDNKSKGRLQQSAQGIHSQGFTPSFVSHNTNLEKVDSLGIISEKGLNGEVV